MLYESEELFAKAKNCLSAANNKLVFLQDRIRNWQHLSKGNLPEVIGRITLLELDLTEAKHYALEAAVDDGGERT